MNDSNLSSDPYRKCILIVLMITYWVQIANEYYLHSEKINPNKVYNCLIFCQIPLED